MAQVAHQLFAELSVESRRSMLGELAERQPVEERSALLERLLRRLSDAEMEVNARDERPVAPSCKASPAHPRGARGGIIMHTIYSAAWMHR